VWILTYVSLFGFYNIFDMFKSSSILYSFARNRRMIAGNWKCNKTQAEAVEFVKNTINTLKYNPDNVGTLPTR
jgi:hypothetical protein